MVKRLSIGFVILLVVIAGCQDSNQKEFRNLPQSTLVFPNTDFLSIHGVQWSRKDQISIQGIYKNTWPIYIGNISTAIAKPILNDGRPVNAFQPVISPNGEWFAFSLHPYEKEYGIKIEKMEELVANQFVVADNKPDIDLVGDFRLAWSPDSSQLALVGFASNSRFQIYLYNLFQGSLVEEFESSLPLATHPWDSRVDFSASWSSDGKYLAFTIELQEQERSQPDIYTYDFTSNTLQNITSTPNVFEYSPSWYPKEEILTYTSESNGELFFSSSDGRCVKKLPELEGMRSPSWSPDGTQIAYESEDGIEILTVKDVISEDFLSKEKLCG